MVRLKTRQLRDPQLVSSRGLIGCSIIVAIACVVGCSSPDKMTCERDGDCFDSEICADGICQTVQGTADAGGEDEDAGSGSGGDEESDAGDGDAGDAEVEEDAGADEEAIAACSESSTDCTFFDGAYEIAPGETYGCDSDNQNFEPDEYTADEATLCDEDNHVYRVAYNYCETTTIEMTARLEPTVDQCPAEVLEDHLDLTVTLQPVSNDCDDYMIDCPYVDDSGALVSRVRIDEGEYTLGTASARWDYETTHEQLALDYRLSIETDEFSP